jgi:hypothetical protein
MAIQRTSVSVPGFSESKSITRRKRMIVSVRGEEREGKTQFGLTAPGPIAVFGFDNNTPELIEKWQMRKKIFVPTEPLDYMDATDVGEWAPVWERFKEMFLKAVASPVVRTIMVDTFTEANELCRLARFGKLTEVPPHFYGKVNAEFKRLVDATYKTDKNVIFIHQLKDQYKKGDRTGERILAGYSNIGYKVQINILCWRDLSRRDPDTGSEGFGITIDNSTQNEALAGTYLEEPDNDFVNLGKIVYPGSVDSDWE